MNPKFLHSLIILWHAGFCSAAARFWPPLLGAAVWAVTSDPIIAATRNVPDIKIRLVVCLSILPPFWLELNTKLIQKGADGRFANHVWRLEELVGLLEQQGAGAIAREFESLWADQLPPISKMI